MGPHAGGRGNAVAVFGEGRFQLCIPPYSNVQGYGQDKFHAIKSL